MPSITLTNPTLKKLTDVNSNSYYLLINSSNSEEVYFCFAKTVVTGWNQLEQAFEQNANLAQVNLEYQESTSGTTVSGAIRTYKRVLKFECLI
ncbi:MAG: hypothetical protein I3274_02660 [Candidatus Moeniiplasma glomeromycotorum]|nr:hypothetical protein [Candidatus Moeniiplasma glomeromycotorum]MCE8167506.1 hypothetical protein [Candidatus Moeniiplasma glomeromycotorum]